MGIRVSVSRSVCDESAHSSRITQKNMFSHCPDNNFIEVPALAMTVISAVNGHSMDLGAGFFFFFSL